MAIANILETALKIATGGLTGVILETTVDLVRKGSEGTMEEPLEKLREDTERQKLAMEMAQAQARVAQELAIARRIEAAADVQIEEYYESAGEGALGLKADGKSLTLGGSGSGQRVSKRIYRFTGGSAISPGSPGDERSLEDASNNISAIAKSRRKKKT
jgi:hypothetical protein